MILNIKIISTPWIDFYLKTETVKKGKNLTLCKKRRILEYPQGVRVWLDIYPEGLIRWKRTR